MLRRPVAARAIVDFAWIGLGVGNELRNAFGWKRRIDLYDVWHADNSGNRREVTEEIVIEFVVEGRVNRMCRTDQEECVAVSRRTRHRLGREVAARSRTVFDDKLLAEPLGQPLSDEPRGDIGAPSRRKSNDDTHGS